MKNFRIIPWMALLIAGSASASVTLSQVKPDETINFDLGKLGKKFVEIPLNEGLPPIILTPDTALTYRGQKDSVVEGKTFHTLVLAMQDCKNSGTSPEVAVTSTKRTIYFKSNGDCTISVRQAK